MDGEVSGCEQNVSWKESASAETDGLIGSSVLWRDWNFVGLELTLSWASVRFWNSSSLPHSVSELTPSDIKTNK